MLNRWHDLIAHPHFPPQAIERVRVRVRRVRESAALKRDRLSLEYRVECPPRNVLVPVKQPPLRRDGLWQTTCCELFVKGPDAAYWEYNFSPSSEWAAYGFDSYRDNARPLACELPPSICADPEPYGLGLEANLQLDGHDALTLGLSAVIEERDGTKSYWALAHPPGAPDFHHADCFTLELPAPDGA